MEDRPRKYRVIKAYESPYLTPIVFQEGERIEIGEEFASDPDWKNWVWCRGKNGKQAWTPHQYLTIRGKTGILRRSYNAMELSVSEGEALLVYDEINGFGMAEKADGTKGWVPMRNLMEEKDKG